MELSVAAAVLCTAKYHRQSRRNMTKKKERTITGRSNSASMNDKIVIEQQPTQNKKKSTRKDASSWGDLLQQYKYGQTHLPWKEGSADKPEFRTSYNIKREERQYDAILCKFRDNHTEDKFARMEKADMNQTITKGQQHAAEHNQT